MSLTISNNGIELIKKFEGCRLSAYKDPVGIITIGYGWTKPIDGRPLTMGMTITQSKAESLLREGLKSYEAKVNKYIAKYNWNQNQFDALVSFCYNIGNIDGLTANGTRSISEIAAKITSYNKAGGKVLPGLTNRRNAEKQLFLSASSTNAEYTYKDFVREVQSAIGAKVDGIAGSETYGKCPTVSRYKNNRHAVVRPLQKYLNLLGHDAGTPDCIAGVKFETAAKEWAKANGCTADGEFTKGGNSWKKILRLI